MGKFTTLLITGENIQYNTDKEVLTRLRRIKQEGGLKKYNFIERSFNTRKQVDVYMQAVKDVNSFNAFVTDNPDTIAEVKQVVKEIYDVWGKRGRESAKKLLEKVFNPKYREYVLGKTVDMDGYPIK